MSTPVLDRVVETTATTGTGPFTLAGALSGFQSFAGVGDGRSCYYCAEAVDSHGTPTGDWEVGLGVYTASGTTLSRSPLSSSNGGALVNFAAGTKRVFLTLPAAATVPQNAPLVGTFLRGATFPRVFGIQLATGDNDVYTVPTGRRAIVFGVRVFNTSAGNISWFVQQKVSSTYYRMSATLTTATNLSGTQSQCCHMLEAGDSLSVNSTTTNGLNVIGHVIEFDAACPVKQGRKLGLTTGDNTVYTCPAGKTAMMIGFTNDASNQLLSVMCGDGTGFFIADGSTRSITGNYVPNGGSPATTNRILSALSVAASDRGLLPFVGNLSAGDSYSVNVDVGNAAQSAYVFVVELDH